MSGPSVLDTNVLLYHLDDKLVDPLVVSDHVIFVITELEVLSHPELTPAVELELRKLLNMIQVIGLTHPIREATINLRRRYRLKLPDAIICATALVQDAQLITSDSRLCRIPEFKHTRPSFENRHEC